MGKKKIKRLRKRLRVAETCVNDLLERVTSIEVVLTSPPDIIISSERDPRAN